MRAGHQKNTPYWAQNLRFWAHFWGLFSILSSFLGKSSNFLTIGGRQIIFLSTSNHEFSAQICSFWAYLGIFLRIFAHFWANLWQISIFLWKSRIFFTILVHEMRFIFAPNPWFGAIFERICGISGYFLGFELNFWQYLSIFEQIIGFQAYFCRYQLMKFKFKFEFHGHLSLIFRQI